MNILITGGASGLGEAMTRMLAHDSAHTVYFTFCNSSKNAAEIERQFPNTRAVKVDFTLSPDVNALIEKFPEMNLEVLINNAMTGDIHKNYFHKTGSEIFENGFMKNVMPVIRITQAAIGIFRKKKSGKIITVLSSAITQPPIGWSEYAAAKSYLASLSKSWAAENNSFGIYSNCISPSFMRTRLTSETDERIVEEMIHQRGKELLTVEDAAKAVLFLVHSGQALTGKNFIIDSAEDILCIEKL